MGIAKLFLALTFVAMLLMAGVGALESGYKQSVTEANTATVVENETWTVDEGNVTQLANSNKDVVYNETVTVHNGNDVVEPDGNYTWYASNGTIAALNGSTFTDGQDATVTYGLTVPQNEQQLARDVGMLLPGVIGYDLIIIIGAAIFIGSIIVFAGMTQ